MKPSRPVIAFALLRQCGDSMHTDFLGGVSVLIRPLISDLAGQVYDANVLAERMANSYGISLPASALEEFTPRLLQAGVLVEEGTGAGISRAVYASFTENGETIQNEAQIQHVIDDFLSHAQERLTSAGRSISIDELTSGLLRRLSTLDFSAIRSRPIVAPEDDKNTLLGPAAKEARLVSEQLGDDAAIDALVASYVSGLQEKSPESLKLLSEIADGALGLELVLDLQAPTAVPRLTSTTAIIDTPLLLAYLDLSSKQHKIVAHELINQLSQSGAKIAAFQHSIDEAESILYAIESRRVLGEAYGPTVQRMAGSPSYRAFFQTMRGRIASEWQQNHKFDLIQEAATQFYKNFTQDDEQQLTNRIRFSIADRYLTSERDAKSVAETMRRLGGAHIPIAGLASCKFIFVTGNIGFQRRSAAFLREKGFVNKGEFMPILTDRYVSGLCWLISGGSSANGPSTARLLSNCATALRARPELIERTKQFLLDLDEQKAKHFEALMTNERASQYLAELTLGNLAVITATNVDDILVEAQRRAAEVVAQERDAHYAPQLAEANSQREASDAKVKELQDRVMEAQLESATKELIASTLAKKSEALENEVGEHRETLSRQATSLADLSANVEVLAAAANTAQATLARQRQQADFHATKYASSRVRALRITGCLMFLAISIAIGYVDKFLIPGLAPKAQTVANALLVCVQGVIAIFGLSLLLDPLFERPMARWRERLYISRMMELGFPIEPGQSESP
ncbi:hypothetical protein [Duganella sp. HH105]|uniref:hypothetical protein n=1 Tax=Duganella sp. HH105 TaxID=1781067 RepID=UPI000892CDDD|nr:hypothetical protein [Duganella sp. HH105]OEZ55662.1 hypothetical protein DUGA6_53160 [Duganella sp. HH105]